MPEVKVLKVFEECADCGESKTITQLACEPLMEKAQMEPDAPVSMRKEPITLLPPQQVTLTMPLMVVHWDVCAGCGRQRCVRVETMDAPVTMQPGKGAGPGKGSGGLFGRGN